MHFPKLTTIALTAIAGVVGACGSAGHAADGRTGVGRGQHLERVTWQVAETGRTGRSVVLQYIPQACAAGPAKARVSQSLQRIRVVLMQPVPRLAPGESCAVGGNGASRRVTVRLRSDLDGRWIEGTTARLHLAYLLSRHRIPLVPRLVGLAPRQAREVLQAQRFRSAVRGMGRQVVAQSPARGKPAGQRAVLVTAG